MIKMQLELRAEDNRLYSFAYTLCSSHYFTRFISLCIVANTVVLALDKYPIEQAESQLLDTINLFFSGVFFLEMVIKLAGLGKKHYFKSRFNSFDFVIVVISCGDVVMTFSDKEIFSGSNAVQALRAFRLLRVFKLAKSWKQF